MRSDVGGNIDRLRGRQATDPQKYELVFDIVLAEVALGSQNGSSSATKGLLWLKRHVQLPSLLAFTKLRIVGPKPHVASAPSAALAGDLWVFALLSAHNHICSCHPP